MPFARAPENSGGEAPERAERGFAGASSVSGSGYQCWPCLKRAGMSAGVARMSACSTNTLTCDNLGMNVGSRIAGASVLLVFAAAGFQSGPQLIREGKLE